MKKLNLDVEKCAVCPYYRHELVVAESGHGYDGLHTCRRSHRAIVYTEKMGSHNDPDKVIPKWCELPNKEETQNVLPEA